MDDSIDIIMDVVKSDNEIGKAFMAKVETPLIIRYIVLLFIIQFVRRWYYRAAITRRLYTTFLYDASIVYCRQ